MGAGGARPSSILKTDGDNLANGRPSTFKSVAFTNTLSNRMTNMPSSKNSGIGRPSEFSRKTKSGFDEYSSA